MEKLIAPSILAADFGNIQRDVEMINESKADWFHIDIMDGMFVPNISFGFPVMEAIKKHANKIMDVHLMIENPDRYIEKFRQSGANYISVHYEACPHLHRTIQLIHQTGAKAGVALNPHTPVTVLKDILPDLEFVCLMSVNPGFGGQKFIKNTFAKVAELKEMIVQRGLKTLIEIDGGVNLDNAYELMDKGADVLVAGSFVFNSEDPKHTISKLKEVGQGVSFQGLK